MSLRWAHTHFVGFIMSRLICFLPLVGFTFLVYIIIIFSLPKDPFPDYLEVTTAFAVLCGGRKTSPRTSV